MGLPILEPLANNVVALAALAVGVGAVGYAIAAFLRQRSFTAPVKVVLIGAMAISVMTGVVWIAGRVTSDVTPEVDIEAGPQVKTSVSGTETVGTLPSAWNDASLGSADNALALLQKGCTDGLDDIIHLSTDGPLSGFTGIGVLDSVLNVPGNLILGPFTKPAACRAEAELRVQMNRGSEGWFNSAFPPHTTPGYPIDRYNLYYQSGVLDVYHNMIGAGTGFIWTVGKFGLKVAMWMLDWAISGRIVSVMGAIPEQIAKLLSVSVVGAGKSFTLGHLALICLGIAGAVSIIRSRYAEAAGNMLFGIIAMSVGMLVLLNFDGYYQGAKNVKEELARSGMIGALADSTTEDGAGNVTVDATGAVAPLLDATVHTPWEVLNFGAPLQTNCEIGVGKDLLLGGVGSNNPYPVDSLNACDTNESRLKAAHASSASWTKLFGAVLAAGGQIAIAVLIMSTAMLALISEMLLAVAFAVLPVAAVAAAFPGGRKIAGMWLSTLLKGIVGLGVGMLFLSLVVTVLDAVVGNTTGLAMIERQLLFILLAVAAMKLRKMVPQAAQKLSATLSGKVASAGAGGGSGGGLGAAAGGVAGGVAGGLAAGAIASQILPPGGGLQAVRMARQAGRGTLNMTAGVAGGVGMATGRMNPEGGIARALGARAHGGSLIGAGSHAAASAMGSRLGHSPAQSVASASGNLSADRITQMAGGNKAQRTAAANVARDPNVLSRLAGDRNPRVRAAAAANPNMPTSYVDEMSRRRSGRVSQNFINEHPTGPPPPPPPGGGGGGGGAGSGPPPGGGPGGDGGAGSGPPPGSGPGGDGGAGSGPPPGSGPGGDGGAGSGPPPGSGPGGDGGAGSGPPPGGGPGGGGGAGSGPPPGGGPGGGGGAGSGPPPGGGPGGDGGAGSGPPPGGGPGGGGGAGSGPPPGGGPGGDGGAGSGPPPGGGPGGGGGAGSGPPPGGGPGGGGGAGSGPPPGGGPGGDGGAGSGPPPGSGPGGDGGAGSGPPPGSGPGGDGGAGSGPPPGGGPGGGGGAGSGPPPGGGPGGDGGAGSGPPPGGGPGGDGGAGSGPPPGGGPGGDGGVPSEIAGQPSGGADGSGSSSSGPPPGGGEVERLVGDPPKPTGELL